MLNATIRTTVGGEPGYFIGARATPLPFLWLSIPDPSSFTFPIQGNGAVTSQTLIGTMHSHSPPPQSHYRPTNTRRQTPSHHNPNCSWMPNANTPPPPPATLTHPALSSPAPSNSSRQHSPAAAHPPCPPSTRPRAAVPAARSPPYR
ncbi:hypothetical protein V490_05495 [Pseudogymnoascus sp. VKM F-3557]|nr:hypothetical protein V490_05495 [Pseudogymnoascus sp. VKM F-3557]